MTVRLAIDALNLARDRRGMGRVVGGVVRSMLEDRSLAVTLLARRQDLTALRQDPRFEGAALREPSSARRRESFDVVWLPWNGMRFGIDAPSLVTVHDLFAFSEPARGAIARRREQAPIARAIRCATRVATTSLWNRAQIAARFDIDERRIVVIPWAPDRMFFPAAGPAPDEKPFVLFVAGPEPRKNAERFFEAFALAFPARDVRLIVAGQLSHADARRLERRPIDAIRVRPADVALRDLYRSAAAVAVPSLAEGFGMVVVEAQACAAPVIAADAAALPQTASDAALLVAPDDAPAWSAALRRIVEDESLAANLRARSAARWSFRRRDEPARRIIAELKSLAERPRR